MFDLRLVVARLAQDLDRVLAKLRRQAGWYLVDAVQPERAGDGERGPGSWIVERHQRAAVHHLTSGRDIVERGDAAEGEAARGEDRLPLGPRARGEHRIEHDHERARLRAPRGRGGEARVRSELRSFDGPQQCGPVAIVVRDVHPYTPSVLTAVEVTVPRHSFA